MPLALMETIVKLSAIRVANQIDLKGIKSMVQAKPIGDSSSELFITVAKGNTYTISIME